ncbi:interferon-inducible GTPase 5-like [Brachionichthys hirsutus]|uniref:interferon-inducible GTPase 5-like n=1 Tax=Brachionichthys hirsutus TaxID=412623 RepID=UPI003604C369
MSNPVDERSAGEIKAALQSNNQALAFAKIKECLKKANNTPLNIAVTGESGSGKSSFVNGFRGVDDSEENAAPTGCGETTTQVTRYPHPSYPNVTLWDLPGIGTMKFPASQYLTHVGFEKYDFFIIISETYFRENDVLLAKEIGRMGKKFYFIRSKVDNDLQAMKRSKKGLSEAETLDQIRRNCTEGLENEGAASPKVFLVSRFDLHLYDFPLLQQTLEEELPEHKRDVLLFAMPNISLEVINKKKKVFQDQISVYAFVSACGAVAPLPGASVALDLTLLVMITGLYKAAFGLDEGSLARLADDAGLPVADLKSVLTSPLSLERITPDLISELLYQRTNTAALLAAEEGSEFIPIIGTAVATTLSYQVTRNALQTFLDMLSEDAQKVLNKVPALSTGL